MRRTWRLALLGLLECSPTPAQLPPDGGQLPPFDASPTGIDAGPLPVTVTVFSSGTPEPGALVAFQDATGAVLGTSKTDAKGTASRVVTAGSQVSVILGTPGSGSLALYTYVGVEPGDALSVVHVGLVGSAALVAVPPSPPPAASYFIAYAGACGAYFAQPPVSLFLTPDCVAMDGKFPLLVLAGGAAPSSLAYAFGKDNTLAGLDAGTATVSLAGQWSTQVGTWTIDAINAPPSGSPTATFGEIANHVSYPQQSGPATAPDAGAASSFETHPGYADSVQSEVAVAFPTGNFTDREIAAIATRTAPPVLDGKATIDLAQLLPAITGASVDFVSDPPRPTVSWKTAGSLASADGTFVGFQWLQAQDGGATADVVTWNLVVPASATSVHVPALPPEASAWTPNGAQPSAPPMVVTIDGLSGYVHLRNLAAAVPPPNLQANVNGPFVPPLPKDGTVRLTLYGPSPQ